jgi:predicted DsbA family dithiol-disulfide isomerase
VERFDADRRSEQVAQRVARDVRDAMRAGVMTTPTLVMGETLHPGVPSAAWVAALG